jgi:hypothetical protein
MQGGDDSFGEFGVVFNHLYGTEEEWVSELTVSDYQVYSSIERVTFPIEIVAYLYLLRDLAIPYNLDCPAHSREIPVSSP